SVAVAVIRRIRRANDSSPVVTDAAECGEQTEPVKVRTRWSSSNRAGSPTIAAPQRALWLPVMNLVAEWTTTSAPSSSARRQIGVATVASQTTRPSWTRTASQSGTVSTGFAGDSTHTMSASEGGAGLVVLEEAEPPPLERPEEPRRAEVRALGQRDRRPGPCEGEDDRRLRGHAGREEERRAALGIPQPRLGLGAGRMPVARVVELAWLAGGVVRPDRRAVDPRPAARVAVAARPRRAAPTRVRPPAARAGRSVRTARSRARTPT